MLLNCGVGEDSWESLGLQGDPTSPFWRRSALDFFGRNDAKAETPILWPPHAKSWLIGKDSDAGRDWGQEEKGTTEDEMAGWHHLFYGRESEWTPGVGDGQGGLQFMGSQWVGHDWATELNWTELKRLSLWITSQIPVPVCFHLWKAVMSETVCVLNLTHGETGRGCHGTSFLSSQGRWFWSCSYGRGYCNIFSPFHSELALVSSQCDNTSFLKFCLNTWLPLFKILSE